MALHRIWNMQWMPRSLCCLSNEGPFWLDLEGNVHMTRLVQGANLVQERVSDHQRVWLRDAFFSYWGKMKVGHFDLLPHSADPWQGWKHTNFSVIFGMSLTLKENHVMPRFHDAQFNIRKAIKIHTGFEVLKALSRLIVCVYHERYLAGWRTVIGVVSMRAAIDSFPSETWYAFKAKLRITSGPRPFPASFPGFTAPGTVLRALQKLGLERLVCHAHHKDLWVKGVDTFGLATSILNKHGMRQHVPFVKKVRTLCKKCDHMPPFYPNSDVNIIDFFQQRAQFGRSK